MSGEKMPLPHRLTLSDRKQLAVTGVTEVVSFDENAVLLHTQLGQLLVQGKDLHLRQLTLDGGQVAVDGEIEAMIYEQPRQSGWLRRLLG